MHRRDVWFLVVLAKSFLFNTLWMMHQSDSLINTYRASRLLVEANGQSPSGGFVRLPRLTEQQGKMHRITILLIIGQSWKSPERCASKRPVVPKTAG